MAIILSVYTNKVFKEIKLPVINNSDYSVTLYKNQIGLIDDIELKLEVIDNEWTIQKDSNYRVFMSKESYEGKKLNNNDIIQLYTYNDEMITIMIKSVKYSISIADKYSLKSINQISIGKNSDCDIIYDYVGLVSREHATLIKGQNGWEIHNNSKNGIYVNSKIVEATKKLEFGDFISIMGLHLIFLGNILAVDNSNNDVVVNKNKLIQYDNTEYETVKNQDDKKVLKDCMVLLHRAPRDIEKIENKEIEIEGAPQLPKPKEQSLLQAIGPSLTMALPMIFGGVLMVVSSKSSGGGSSLYMLSGMIMSVMSAILGVIWAIVNIINQKKNERDSELQRYEAYGKYLVEKADIIRTKYRQNFKAMHDMYKDAAECVYYDENSSVLWNRNKRHDDFMFYRLGLGNIPFQVNIKTPQITFAMDEDNMRGKPEKIRENFKTLYNVPVGIDLLKNQLVGLVGGEDRKGAIEVIKLLATQIAANNCYTDIKMVFAYDTKSEYNLDQWEFAKWFPHVWSEDKNMRFVASNKSEASDVFFGLAKVFRQRDDLGISKKAGVQKPHYILFLINPELIEGELISKYIYDTGSNYGITTIVVSDSRENLPNEIEVVIENTDNYKGIYNVSEQKEDNLEIKYDSVSKESLNEFSRRLSNIYVKETDLGGDIPEGISFLDMYGVSRIPDLNVLDRWKKNRTYDNIKGMLGERAGGTTCYLDVHEKYHGPHGLVAGTTGSGKSETLQTYMLSLAVNYSPDDIGYFIIDYKGGGMANLFNGLPHLIGQISNLSGNQVHRAMVSIKSENRRRQRVFNEAGVNNINLYTKLYKNNEVSLPVPHLFIIIDEFAELKREEPDFMRELISVAQVGRSLGVHLILATQKPSGTVDENIWSNTKFRLCLRVADKQDSNDMLHKPDAAYITQAGRCYLQVGNDEVFELFQSGYSGATYNEEDDSAGNDIARLLALTGRVDMTGSYSKTTQKEKILIDWYGVIERHLALALQKEGIDMGQCVASKNRMFAVIDNMYESFENEKVDYPISAYNTARLEDYIKTYMMAASYSGEVLKNIIVLSAQKGIKLPQPKEKTQLDAVKDYLAVVARENGYTHELQLWMPVLPTKMYLNKFDDFNNNQYKDGQWPAQPTEWNIEIVYGMYDDPQNQAQMPVYVNFSEGGHHAICGAVVSGKSTSLQTMTYALINKYTPKYINFYAIDFSSKMMSAFENAPHFGGVMYEGDDDKIAKFFNMINSILAERKLKFRGGNYSQYIQVHGVEYPLIFVVIDNFGAFNEKTGEKYFDDLVTLSKEGVGHGIILIVTGGGFAASEIPTKIGENIKTVLCTEMADRYAYMDVLRSTTLSVLPEAGIKGRGLANYGNRVLEYQTALAFETDDDYKRIEVITELCEDMANAWNGRKARPVPEIPEKPVWSTFHELEDFEKVLNDRSKLPMAYDAENASIYGVDLAASYCYLVTGFAKSGKKNFMKVLIQSALMKDSQICIIDGPSATMKTYEYEDKVDYVTDENGLFDFLQKLIPEFQRRNKIKREMIEDDCEESEIFERMSEEQPIFIFISDFKWLVEVASGSELGIQGCLENLIEKGELHYIYFFANIGLDSISEIDYNRMVELFLKYKTGIHFGGNVGDCRVFNFDAVDYKEQSKLLKPGIGMVPIKMTGAVDKVVVPFARR